MVHYLTYVFACPVYVTLKGIKGLFVTCGFKFEESNSWHSKLNYIFGKHLRKHGIWTGKYSDLIKAISGGMFRGIT